MILSAFGIPDYSPLQISDFLRSLCMSHVLEGSHLSTVVDGLSVEQPVWPIVVSGVRSVPRLKTQVDRQVLFVCDCRSALDTANLKQDLWPENRGQDILGKLKKVLIASAKSKDEWALSTSEPTTLEYVESASKPSYLNGIQSAIYRVAPYALRKEVQHLVISYLAGITPYIVLNKKLRSSLKLQDLHELLNQPKAKELRQAVLMLSSMSVEDVALSTGFEQFEILYVSRSSEKSKV